VSEVELAQDGEELAGPAAPGVEAVDEGEGGKVSSALRDGSRATEMQTHVRYRRSGRSASWYDRAGAADVRSCRARR